MHIYARHELPEVLALNVRRIIVAVLETDRPREVEGAQVATPGKVAEERGDDLCELLRALVEGRDDLVPRAEDNNNNNNNNDNNDNNNNGSRS